MRQIDQVERWKHVLQRSQVVRQCRLHASLLQFLSGSGQAGTRGLWQPVAQFRAQRARSRLVVRNLIWQVSAALAARAQHPARRALRNGGELAQQVQLQMGFNPVIERVDPVPKTLQVKHLARQREGAHHVGSSRRGFGGEEVDKGGAGAIHHRIGDVCRNDLALERMACHCRREPFAQHFWKIRGQGTPEKRIVGKVACHQFIKHRHLGVSHHHRAFRRCQSDAPAAPAVDLLVGRQILDGPVQSPCAFEPLQQALLAAEQVERAVSGNLQCLGLVVVVLQHQLPDFVGHRSEQVVALLECQIAGLNDLTEQDLDVHLVVRAVHAGRVVDGVGIDEATFLRELDAAILRAAEVAALGQHLAAQFAPIHAKGVTRLVTDLLVALERSLDIGADAAVVQQVHR